MKFNYKWFLSDGFPAAGIKKHNHKVFSCFACGGGSSMGYKLAGYDVLGHCDIDPRMIAVYKSNLHPKYSFVSDIRKMSEIELPDELYNLDILDGSPPCSTFSMSGSREKAWGKKKIFREGQAAQTLDDLFFEFLKFANRIKPKIIVAENVKGLILGKARKYVSKIFETLNNIGYEAQLFLLNSATMGVPQKRERVFFVAQKKENFKKLHFVFNESPIYFKDICDYEDVSKSDFIIKRGIGLSEKQLNDVNMRLRRKYSQFNYVLVRENEICPTIPASSSTLINKSLLRYFNKREYCLCGSYPLDYNFGKEAPHYLIGMSVPPVMMAQIAHQIYLQILSEK